MPKISRVRPVLLSAPYASPDNLEVQIHLKNGLKTCSLVEITLDDGTTGLGEGYLGVFAPGVFAEIVKLVAPYLVGREAFDTKALYTELCNITGYWSFQGAARHVVSACEIALLDAKAKVLDLPVYQLLGGATIQSLKLYGSGGDSDSQAGMLREMETLSGLGIDLFKIRARNFEVAKAVWVLEQASQKDISVGIDMAQNLAIPAQTVGEVVQFVETVHSQTSARIAFLEEVLGPMDLDSYPLLRQKLSTKICGGEIVTNAAELCERVRRHLYDFVQPDATVIGGIMQTLEVFAACQQNGSTAVVHAWGGAVCLMANYHAAFAGGGTLAEWPLPEFELRQALLAEPLEIKNGKLQIPTTPGLGVQLTPELEKFYAFREEAVYSCRPDPGRFRPPRSGRPSASCFERRNCNLFNENQGRSGMPEPIPMNQRLTRENLHGIWAAIATPFDANDRFDEAVFREDIRRLAASGVHGIYTTDSDGEFYAIELDEFKQIITVFADETQRLGIPTQVGVTWVNTKGMLDRLQFAASKGILGAHVGHPFFMPMSKESYAAFWQDIQAAVPDWFALIHYNTPRVHNYQRGPDYAILEKTVPNLIGTKHVGSDFPEFMTLQKLSPNLAHFTGEHAFTPYAMFGAKGVYSWFANYNAPYMVAWYDDIVNGRWEEARHRQQRIHAFSMAKEIVAGSGNLHGIIGKAVNSTSAFLTTPNYTRKPYLPVDPAAIKKFQRVVEEELPDLIFKG